MSTKQEMLKRREIHDEYHAFCERLAAETMKVGENYLSTFDDPNDVDAETVVKVALGHCIEEAEELIHKKFSNPRFWYSVANVNILPRQTARC